MRLDSAIDLKETLIARNYDAQGHNAAVRAQSLNPDVIAGNQLSIGLSQHGDDDYHMEIRIRDEAGDAFNTASTLKARYENEVHVGILEQIRVPFQSDSASMEQNCQFLRERCRPLHLGVSVSHQEGTAGSLGGFVQVDGQRAVISNAHVFGGQKRIRIFHPGREDVPSRQLCGAHEIGTVGDYTTFSKRGSNYLDAAYGILDDDFHNHRGNKIPEGFPDAGARLKATPVEKPHPKIEDFAEAWSNLSLQKNSEVAKVGRSTGYTIGLVSGFAIDDIIVDMNGLGSRRFDNLLEIQWKGIKQPFAQPGDSGSLVFIPGRNEAVGLHFAGGTLRIDGEEVGVSYACSLAHVLSMFRLTFM